MRKEAKREPEDEMPLSFSLLLHYNVCTSSTVPSATTEMVKINNLKIGFEKYNDCSQAPCQTQRPMLKIRALRSH